VALRRRNSPAASAARTRFIGRMTPGCWQTGQRYQQVRSAGRRQGSQHGFLSVSGYGRFLGLFAAAEASGANVLGICSGAGADSVNIIKQAHEFGLHTRIRLASMLISSTVVHALGLKVAQGLHLTETFYWDLNDRTRSFMDRIRPKTPSNWPNMFQAGNYSATLHYLKAVSELGIAAAKADGRAVVDRMKAMPTDDRLFRARGSIRVDGRKLHPSYLFQVKSRPTARRSGMSTSLSPLRRLTRHSDVERGRLPAGSRLTDGRIVDTICHLFPLSPRRNFHYICLSCGGLDTRG